jgi:hypothetical protein
VRAEQLPDERDRDPLGGEQDEEGDGDGAGEPGVAGDAAGAGGGERRALADGGCMGVEQAPIVRGRDGF